MSTYIQTQARPPPAALGRKNSFFGAIKNIVTAPLSWFGGSEEDFDDGDSRGKRRRLPIASEQIRDDSDSDSEQRTKRMRMGSPNRDKQPYLDPPRSAFRQHHRTSEGARIQNHHHVSPSPRKALRVPTATPRNRRTMSPYPSGSQLKAQPSVRTMSLDPPSGLGYSGSPARLQSVPTMQDLTEEKDAMSISREPSISNLRMRTSVTPQPSGSDFGPVIPPRRERDPTEPPPLTTLMSNPMFVKPPPGLQKSSTADMTRQATLGSLLDSQRKQTHSPVRRGSVLFGTGSMTDISAPHLWPINPAEKALHELEVYKTPLLPSRLKGAPIPDTFISKKSRPITLMHDRDRERKKGKGKNKMKDRDGVNGTKPYAGEGGMKKWLARRKREEEAVRAYEEADREKDKERAMEEDESAEAEAERLSEQQQKAQAEEAQRKKQMEVATLPKAPAFEPKLSTTREMSSLRVGRSRMRNHIERPSAKRTNKFSAAFEDDEDVMDDERVALEEAAKKVPVFEIPAGFTFAKETSIPHDATGAKEPPISALPFSLSKPIAPAAKPVSAPEPSAASAPAVPTISFVPPTPQPPKSEERTEPAPVTATLSTSASNMPNFFANTAAYTKPLAVTTPSGSFGAPPPVLASTPPAQVPEAPKVTEASTSLFGAPVTAPQVSGTPSATPAANSMFGATPVSASTSIFGPPPASTGTSFGALAPPKAAPAVIEVTSVVSPVISPPPAHASTPAPSSSPFLFSASTAPAEISPANKPPKPEQEASKPPSLIGVTPSAVPFSFGTPAVSAPAAELSKPGFSFGEREPTPAMTEPSKSAFSFGGPAPSTTPAPVPAPLIETPKPFFGKQDTTSAAGFSFGPRPSTAPAEEKPASVLPPFSFASASPAPAEKKPFTFGTSSPAPPTATAKPFSFGHANAGSNTADTSKPFNFGQSAPAPAPARSATPPKVDQEISMDESPSRDMNTNGKAPERLTLDFSSFPGASSTPAGSTLFAQSPATATGPGFGFNTASANPFAKPEDKEKPGMAFGSGSFGQPSGSGFGFGQGATETPAPASAAPFSFSQAASPNVAPTPGFGFSQTATNAFGQQQNTSSAPSSPSAFNRPGTSFSFGTPASTQPAAPSFAFGGSQPASPATSAGGLPQPSGGGFAFGQSGAAPAATPNSFAPTTASSGGGALFTIGAAPQPDGRQIKKLPRRGVGRR